ncbi:hypothetical protein AGMMS49992_11800 [Clostridia bacterium]|nr:hypothetical protein AGMMS49992_11800 [Clostridia bacterium]
MDNNRMAQSVRLDKIEQGIRLRMGAAKIEDMMESLRHFGLINPITVADNADGTFTLIAGDRRRRAALALGWKEISATVMSPLEAEEQLLFEREENVQRMKFTHAANVEFMRRMQSIEAAKARVAKTVGLNRGNVRSVEVSTETPVRDDRPAREKRRVREKLAQEAGYASGRQVARVLHIADERPDLIEKMDTDGITVNAALRIMEDEKDADEVHDASPIAGNIAEDGDDEVIVVGAHAESTIAFNRPSVRCGKPNICNVTHEDLLENPVYNALRAVYDDALLTIGKLTKEINDLRTRLGKYETIIAEDETDAE